MLTLSLLLALALPPGSVVVGVSPAEGTETRLLVIVPSGEHEEIGALEHLRGHVPKGIVVGDRLLTNARVGDDVHGVLEETVLSSGARRLLLDRVLATQPPTIDAAGRALAVRQEREGHFVVVRSGAEVARIDASWVTPVRGVPAAFLVIDQDRSRVVQLDPSPRVLSLLGRGPWRSAAIVRREVVAERRIDGVHAVVIAAVGPTTLQAGLTGMDPIACGGDRVAIGGGSKRATIRLLTHGARGFTDLTTIDIGRSGVASPKACALINQTPLVIAWIDRGASLPGELWRASADHAAPLIELAPGDVVEVYGIIERER